jgi:hypothetical protein
MSFKKFIVRVFKSNIGQKLATVPKRSDIEAGDYIEIKKVDMKEDE